MHDYQTTNEKQFSQKIFYFGEVVSIIDPFESRTIKVRLSDFDSKIENQDLPDAYPMQVAFFHYVPQVGERVMVFLDRHYNADKSVNQEKRYYLAVTISQPQRIDYDPFHYTASSNESDGWTQREKPISEIPEAKGTYAEKDVIGFIGRKNTDILQKDGEILIRAGKHLKENKTQFNNIDPAYIQIRHGLNNASNARKTKVVTEVEIIPATHIITVVADEKNRLTVRVFRVIDGFINENHSNSFDNRDSLVIEAKTKIKEFQLKYRNWSLKTDVPELSSLPKMFPNNQKFVRKEVEIKEQNQYDQFAGSVINIVAQKINLLSHKSEKAYNLTDPVQTIDAETQLEINSTSHQMVKGDVLRDFLKLVVSVLTNHVHPYHGKNCSREKIVEALLNFNLDSLLDENIRLG